jgi:hypothetical protein
VAQFIGGLSGTHRTEGLIAGEDVPGRVGLNRDPTVGPCSRSEKTIEL